MWRSGIAVPIQCYVSRRVLCFIYAHPRRRTFQIFPSSISQSTCINNIKGQRSTNLTHFPNHRILSRPPTQRSGTSLNTQASIQSMKPRRRSLRGQWSPLQIFIRPSSTATTTATVSHLDSVMRITPRGLPCNKITPKPIKKPPPTTQIPKNLPLALDHAPHK